MFKCLALYHARCGDTIHIARSCATKCAAAAVQCSPTHPSTNRHRPHNTYRTSLSPGVEFSGTLADYVRQDLRRKYPELMPLVRVSLLQSAQSILTMFDRDLQDRAIRQLQSQGVDVQLGVKVGC